jgi:uncharacterized membrane protein YidH (DUF202 family)
MKATRMLGIALLACGILALAYGGFTYTKSASQVELGPIAFEVQERERVNIPLWIGIGLAVAGGALMVAPGSRS